MNILLTVGHGALGKENHIHLVRNGSRVLTHKVLKLFLVQAKAAVHQRVHQLHLAVHLPGNP